MVDVVFVLLLFFMASAGARLMEKELSLDLPGPPQSSSMTRGPLIVIEISANGRVVANGRTFGDGASRELKGLREWLRTALESGEKTPVLIRPADDTRQERVIDVLDACAAAQVKNLKFG